MVQVGIMGGELNVSLVALILKGVTIFGNYTGSPTHLKDVASLARDGKLDPVPVTTVPWDDADKALERLRQGQVTGRLVLTR